MEKDVVSVEALELALRLLVSGDRVPLHICIADEIQWFQETSSHLEGELDNDDNLHPAHLRDDLRKIAEIFRSVGKVGDRS